MKRFWLLCSFTLFTLTLLAQTFQGRVVDERGEGVSYAAIYIEELMRGFTVDEDGYFQVQLPVGSFQCEVSSLGFTSRQINVNMTIAGVNETIVLKDRIYSLSEVVINNKGEDPAYAIMRKAIAYAPHNRNMIKGYTAEMYLKGSGKLKKIPSILKLSKSVREDARKYMGKLFLLEEHREVIFKSPDTWEGDVIAYSNTFPENVRVEIGLSMIRFYEPLLLGKISPLSKGAFSYYRYKLEGCFVDGEQLINKIKVIPRKDNPQLLSGDLYIVDNCWCVSEASLKVKVNGAEIDAQIICKEVSPSVYLPVSVNMETQIDMMGVKADANYLASVNYLNIDTSTTHSTLNNKVEENKKVSKSTNKKQQKLQAKIDKLNSKEDITLSDAYQLSKLIEKQIKETDTLKKANRYELEARSTKLKTDSLATFRDSIYWQSVRSVPLKLEEKQSYAYHKELSLHGDTISKQNKTNLSNKLLSILLSGKTYRSNNDKVWLTLYGLSTYVPEYNMVDGFWVGATVSAGFKLSETATLSFIPSAYYATARNSFVGSLDIKLNYAPRHLGELQLSGGQITADYNGSCGESRFINSISSSLFGRNDLKLYEKRFATISNQIELANSLLLTTSLTWQRRSMLRNYVQHSWFGKKVKPNAPSVSTFHSMPINELLKMTLGLEYTPAHYYKISLGKKVYEKSVWPTFSIQYEKAFDINRGATSSAFQSFSLSAKQNIEFGMFNQLKWNASCGLFWDRSNMQFPDFKHFSSSGLPITEQSFDNTFVLLNNYAFSNNTQWAQAHVSWYAPYLIVKQLPFLKRYLFDEALHLRVAKVNHFKPYTELGYSVGITEMARVGVFVGFQSFNYQHIGVSVSVPILKTLKRIQIMK